MLIGASGLFLLISCDASDFLSLFGNCSFGGSWQKNLISLITLGALAFLKRLSGIEG